MTEISGDFVKDCLYSYYSMEGKYLLNRIDDLLQEITRDIYESENKSRSNSVKSESIINLSDCHSISINDEVSCGYNVTIAEDILYKYLTGFQTEKKENILKKMYKKIKRRSRLEWNRKSVDTSLVE